MSQVVKIAGISLLLSLLSATANATDILLNITDGPAEGFNDSTPVAPVTGNSGITLGEQRLNVFAAAVEHWETRLQSNVDITVDASFDPLNCQPLSAVLGSAGPQGAYANFPGAPLLNTFYPAALANSLVDSDLSSSSEIVAAFNSNLDLGSSSCLGGQGWDYRIGVDTGSPFDLFSTVVHELAHGLGFLTLYNEVTGAKLQGLDDVFMAQLADRTTGMTWPSMNNSQRLASSVNTSNLVWTGNNVASSPFTGQLTSGLQVEGVQMYAPNPIEYGSSVSHWDTALSPDELMEPLATVNNNTGITVSAFADMGWQTTPQTVTSETNLVTSCLAGLGRVDLNIVNRNLVSSSIYELTFEGLAARQRSVDFEDWGRISITGRPAGTYSVLVTRDGQAIIDTSVTFNCNASVPPVSSPEITIVNACRSNLGQVFFQFVNSTATTRPYVIEFEGVPNRSTTAAAYGQSRRGTTGRPNGLYNYEIRTASTVLKAGEVLVDCS